jgi:hypothetical protein
VVSWWFLSVRPGGDLDWRENDRIITAVLFRKRPVRISHTELPTITAPVITIAPPSIEKISKTEIIQAVEKDFRQELEDVRRHVVQLEEHEHDEQQRLRNEIFRLEERERKRQTVELVREEFKKHPTVFLSARDLIGAGFSEPAIQHAISELDGELQYVWQGSEKIYKLRPI